MLFRETFRGGPHALGLAQGMAYRHLIAAVVSAFAEHPNAWTDQRVEAEAWFGAQREKHFDVWPWLADEISGIAQGSGIPRHLIERLNFRIWQYPVYGVGKACSSFVGDLADGRTIIGGSLDDPRWIYGFVDVQPVDGLRYMTFPICGTVWGNRGMNEAGLVLSTSSQVLDGLRFGADSVWQQDLCVRVLLQTCVTCEDVLAFCHEHPFFHNIIVADSRGRYAAFTCGPLGVHQYGPSVRCLTNHLLPQVEDEFRRAGWDGSIRSDTTRRRWEQLATWLNERNGRLTLEEAKRVLASRPYWPSGSVNNVGTAVMILAIPQAEPRSLWVADRPVTAEKFAEYAFD